MFNCKNRIVPCGVPGCHDVMRQSEMGVHSRENARKHLDLYAIDEQKKAWSLKEVRILLVMIIKLVIFLTYSVQDGFIATRVSERK